MFEQVQGQDWLIETMQAFGYEPNPNGVCFGVAQMATHAILLKQQAEFNNRLKLIYCFYRDTLPAIKKQQAEKLKKIESRLRESARLFVERAASKKTPQQQVEMFNDAYQALLKKYRLKWFEELLSQIKQKDRESYKVMVQEFKPFFEGIILYQEVYKHRALLSKDAVVVTQEATFSQPFALPKGLPHGYSPIAQFTGVYYSRDLIQLFRSLQYQLIGIEKPISLVLRAEKHAICIGYDPLTQEWTFMNANRPPLTIITSIVDLAEAVIEALRTSIYADRICMGTFIYAENTTNRLKPPRSLSEKITKWINSAIFKKLHVLVERVTDASWFYLAALMGDANAVHDFLMKGKVDVNSESPASQSTPLHSAVIKNQRAIVEELLIFGANVNVRNGLNVTPLYMALDTGNLYLFELLLNYGAVLDEQILSKIGSSEKNLPFVELLLKRGVKSEHLLKHAVQRMNVDVIQLVQANNIPLSGDQLTNLQKEVDFRDERTFDPTTSFTRSILAEKKREDDFIVPVNSLQYQKEERNKNAAKALSFDLEYNQLIAKVVPEIRDLKKDLEAYLTCFWVANGKSALANELVASISIFLDTFKTGNPKLSPELTLQAVKDIAALVKWMEIKNKKIQGHSFFKSTSRLGTLLGNHMPKLENRMDSIKKLQQALSPKQSSIKRIS